MNSPVYSRLWLGRILVAMFAMAGPLSGRAEVAASFVPPQDPGQAESGWTASGRTKAGTLVESPEPAWRIAPEKGSALTYIHRQPDILLAEAFARGWKFTARIRLDPTVVSPVGRYVASMGVESQAKKEAFVLHVRTSEADGGLLVEINGKAIPLPGLASDSFHSYAVTYDPVSSTVRVEADGETVAENIAPVETNRWFLRWGHSSISAMGAAEWAAVRFETGPAGNP